MCLDVVHMLRKRKDNVEMKKHYMSVLGTGNYQACNYAITEENHDVKAVKEFYETKYIQAAVFRMICHDYSDGDKITIFMTQEAKERHWDKLKEELEQLIASRNQNISLNDVMVREGMDDDQQWENFNIIYSQIEDEEQIIVDVTHGFRTIPMQLFTILNYAKALKDIDVARIYYGAFERKMKINNVEYSPIVDYVGYMTIMELANAANVFSATGNAKLLHKVTKKVKDEGFKANTPQKHDLSSLDKISLKIEQLTESIQCARGKDDVCGKSIQQDYLAYNSVDMPKSSSQGNEAKAIYPIIQYVDHCVDKYFHNISQKSDDVSVGMCTVKWCKDYGLIQAGFTALEETIISWVFSRVILKKCVEVFTGETEQRRQREALSRMLTELKGEKSLETESELKQIFSQDKLDKLARISWKIKQCRNDMNHFGFSTDNRSTRKLCSQLEEYYEEFQKLKSECDQND